MGFFCLLCWVFSGLFCFLIAWRCPAQSLSHHVLNVVISGDLKVRNVVMKGFAASTLLPPSLLLLLGAGSDVEAFCSSRSNSHTKVPVEVFISIHFALLKRVWKCQIFSNQNEANQ